MPRYFTADDALAIARELKLDLKHDDGGLAAGELLNKVARRFVSDCWPEANVAGQCEAWADRLQKAAAGMLGLLNVAVEGQRTEPHVAQTLDTLRLLLQPGNKKDPAHAAKSRLASSGRILARASTGLGGYDGDPFPVTFQSISYIHAFAAAVRDLYTDPVRRTRSSDRGANELVKGLEKAYVAIFGKVAGVSTNRKTGRRDGPAVRFIRCYVRILSTRLDDDTDQQRTVKLLRSWSVNDALPNRLSNMLANRKRRGMGK